VGLREVQAMMSSSVIGATPGDVLFFGGMAVVALGFVLMTRRRLVVLVTDPTMAAAVGMRVGWWTGALALAMGVGTGVAMRSTGMLYTFGCLVLPPLVAKNLCREVAPMFWVAPLVAAGSVAVGLVVAHTWDFPPGQTMVAVQALALLAAWGWREGRTWMWE
jgi:ABC-type Mn2+/Zn2+ transport system permease subunit